MIRQRMYGSDVPFCAWMRSLSDELPSFSVERRCGFVATDVDLLIHRYFDDIEGKGSRKVQSLMRLEIKTRGGGVHDSQRDTLWKDHNSIVVTKKGEEKVKTFDLDGQTIKHFGVSFVFLSGTSPDDSDQVEWGRFQPDGTIKRRDVTREQLIQLLKFELHPKNLTLQPFRLHHKTREILQTMKTELGFEVTRPIILRS